MKLTILALFALLTITSAAPYGFTEEAGDVAAPPVAGGKQSGSAGSDGENGNKVDEVADAAEGKGVEEDVTDDIDTKSDADADSLDYGVADGNGTAEDDDVIDDDAGVDATGGANGDAVNTFANNTAAGSADDASGDNGASSDDIGNKGENYIRNYESI